MIASRDVPAGRNARVAQLLAIAPLLGLGLAVVQLAWEASHGGIQSHHLLARADLPSVSNIWGVVVLPALGWLAALFVRLRSERSPAAVRHALIAFGCALVLGCALSVTFRLGLDDASAGVFLTAILASLVAPVYRAEYVFGFVVGMTWVFGPVLPTIAGTLVATISVLAHFVLRPMAVAAFRRVV